jgi:hypothetical protein
MRGKTTASHHCNDCLSSKIDSVVVSASSSPFSKRKYSAKDCTYHPQIAAHRLPPATKKPARLLNLPWDFQLPCLLAKNLKTSPLDPHIWELVRNALFNNNKC